MNARAPGSVSFERHEIDFINEMQVALLLHKLPEEVRKMKWLDFEGVLAIHNANMEIEAIMVRRGQ